MSSGPTRLSSDEALAALRDLAAQDMDEEQVARALLDLTLQAASPELADAVRVCALPAWFDAVHLALLTKRDEKEAADLVKQITEFSFVLPRDAEQGGYTYHEATRARLLDWWRQPKNRPRYAELTERLARNYLALAEEHGSRIKGPDYREALDAMDAAWPSLTASWQGIVETENWPLVRDLASALADYFMYRRLVREWISWTETGSEACQHLGDAASAADLQNNLGIAYRNLGDHKQAIDCYREALRFLTPEATPLDYATTQNNLGIAYHNLGDYERAIECYREALRYCTPEAAPMDYAMTQNNLGLAYRNLGDYEQAIDCYWEALRFLTPEAAPMDYAKTQNKLGIAYMYQEEYERAFEAYGRALAVNPEDATTTYNSACTHALRGDAAAAIDWLGKAIALDEKYRQLARDDDDFAALRDDERFRALVGVLPGSSPEPPTS
jgi:tetratricopeptide (TPR) repeat protein